MIILKIRRWLYVYLVRIFVIGIRSFLSHMTFESRVKKWNTTVDIDPASIEMFFSALTPKCTEISGRGRSWALSLLYFIMLLVYAVILWIYKNMMPLNLYQPVNTNVHEYSRIYYMRKAYRGICNRQRGENGVIAWWLYA